MIRRAATATPVTSGSGSAVIGPGGSPWWRGIAVGLYRDHNRGIAARSQSKDAEEASMAEILSSIRRIIADEEKARAVAGAPASSPLAAADDDEILDLTE